MKTYLVFEPPANGRGADSADGVLFLREKFFWMALFFTPLWLLWHRLWLAFVGWLCVATLIAGISYWLELDPNATAIVLWLPSLVVAFEGTELRRRKLLRLGYRDAGVAVGKYLEDAERRYFASWGEPPAFLPEKNSAEAAIGRGKAPSSLPSAVVGLFPQPGAGR